MLPITTGLRGAIVRAGVVCEGSEREMPSPCRLNTAIVIVRVILCIKCRLAIVALPGYRFVEQYRDVREWRQRLGPAPRTSSPQSVQHPSACAEVTG